MRGYAPKAKADEAHGESVPSVLNDGQAVPADAHAFEALEPGIGAFHYPSELAKTGTVFGATLGDERFDSQPTQQQAVGFAVIASIRQGGLGVFFGASRFALDVRKLVNDGFQLLLVAGVGFPSCARPAAHPLLSTSSVCLVPDLARSVGLGPVSPPQPGAGTIVLSMTTTSKSSLPSRLRRASSFICNASQTPFSCHRCNLRCAVRRAPHDRKNIVPANAGRQNIPNHRQHDAIAYRRPSAPGPNRRVRRKQGL